MAQKKENKTWRILRLCLLERGISWEEACSVSGLSGLHAGSKQGILREVRVRVAQVFVSIGWVQIEWDQRGGTKLGPGLKPC